MTNRLPLLLALGLLLLPACVSTAPRYASLNEVAPGGQPLYSRLDTYMTCAATNFQRLAALAGSATAEQAELLADRACAGCSLILAEYEQFVLESTGDQAFAAEEADKLQTFTRDKLVEAALSPPQD